MNHRPSTSKSGLAVVALVCFIAGALLSYGVISFDRYTATDAANDAIEAEKRHRQVIREELDDAIRETNEVRQSNTQSIMDEIAEIRRETGLPASRPAAE